MGIFWLAGFVFLPLYKGELEGVLVEPFTSPNPSL